MPSRPLSTENGKRFLSDQLITDFNVCLACPSCHPHMQDMQCGYQASPAFNRDQAGRRNVSGERRRYYQCKTAATGRTVRSCKKLSVSALIGLASRQLTEAQYLRACETAAREHPGSTGWLKQHLAYVRQRHAPPTPLEDASPEASPPPSAPAFDPPQLPQDTHDTSFRDDLTGMCRALHDLRNQALDDHQRRMDHGSSEAMALRDTVAYLMAGISYTQRQMDTLVRRCDQQLGRQDASGRS